MLGKSVRAALALATVSTASLALAEAPAVRESGGSPASLEQQFRDPPANARPRVWWHWMNGNVTKDGIAKDLAWMKRVGIGGVQTFDVNLNTPTVVQQRLVYMAPQWKDAFRFAADEAARLGLELAIASSPGFSETGGPWVKPEDGLKKLVWSETEVLGGRPFTGKLADPPSTTGPFQSLDHRSTIMAMMSGGGEKLPSHYGEIAVLAYPLTSPPLVQPAQVLGSDDKPVDPAKLSDADYSSTVDLPLVPPSDRRTLTFIYDGPQTVRAASMFIPRAWMMFFGPMVEAHLEAESGGAWRKIADLTVAGVPTTASFAPVTASRFRLVTRFTGLAPDGVEQPAEGVAEVNPLMRVAVLGARPLGIGEFHLFAEPRVDRFEAKAGFTLVPDYFALAGAEDDVRGPSPAQVIDLTSRLRSDGTLDWTPPQGRWRVLRLGYSLLGTTNHPAPAEATGLEVDKFDGPAVRRYMEHYLGMYADVLGEPLARQDKLDAVLTDSIEVGAANWTPRMIEQFRRLRGYDPMPWLPTLTGAIVGSRGRSEQFLYDYRRTLADLIASQHYGTVATVAHEQGLKVYGEALESGRNSLGDDMAMRRYADVPMAAMWTYARQQGPKPSYIADIRGAASVAHIYGQNLVAAESLTSSYSPWAFGPADLKRIIDLEFALGVNRPVIHTSVHQPVDNKVPGISMGPYGQYFTRHEAWADLAGPWIDYIARNSLMLQQGRNVADVAYFYGEETPLSGLFNERPIADAPKTYAYDFINADALTGALSNDGGDLVTPGGARYRALYLGGSSRQMTLPVLRKLASLVEAGASVIGAKPVSNPSLAGDAGEWNTLVSQLWPGSSDTRVGQGRVIASNDVEAGLLAIGVKPDFRYDDGQGDSEILFAHRQLADGDSYFVSNRAGRAETVEARFRVTGKAPELWHAETGTSEPVSYRTEGAETIVPLALAAEESVHVVFRKPAVAAALTIATPPTTGLVTLNGPWEVAFQPGRGAPASTTMASLAPLNESPLAGIRYFSGTATYTTTFTAPSNWRQGQPLWLDLGEAREVAEVWVNGRRAGAAWHAPYRVDISAAMKPGRNRLEVRVANLWVNRLIGDAQPGAQKITWTSGQTYRAETPLRRSGLIGPVRLLGATR